MNRLVEKLDDERSVKDQLIKIATILKQLGELNNDKLSEVESSLTLELRAISKNINEIEKINNNNKKYD